MVAASPVPGPATQASSPTKHPDRRELFLAFVAPTGSSFSEVADAFRTAFALYDYSVQTIRLSAFLELRAGSQLNNVPEERRIELLQDEGNKLRSDSGRTDALTAVAVMEIQKCRAAAPSVAVDTPLATPVTATAYLVWSFKTPAEVRMFRSVYGDQALVIGVHCPVKVRRDKLAARLAHKASGDASANAMLPQAMSLINRDAHEEEASGQKVGDAYPIADAFVDASSLRELRKSSARIVDLIFGAPFVTPSRDEHAMNLANAASLRSAEMGRQVGAAATTRDGVVVAVGTNEVPKAGGGQYWPDDAGDAREFQGGRDTSDDWKINITQQVFNGLSQKGLLGKGADLKEFHKVLMRTRIKGLLEFGRAVHAEMALLSDAALRGVPLLDLSCYVTTFPCHNCARHLVAAGFSEVVYIYPYEKSLAEELHHDSIEVEPRGPSPGRVAFRPFIGIAPRRFHDFFEMGTRKREGQAVAQRDATRVPIFGEERRSESTVSYASYINREAIYLTESWVRQHLTN